MTECFSWLVPLLAYGSVRRRDPLVPLLRELVDKESGYLTMKMLQIRMVPKRP